MHRRPPAPIVLGLLALASPLACSGRFWIGDHDERADEIRSSSGSQEQSLALGQLAANDAVEALREGTPGAPPSTQLREEEQLSSQMATAGFRLEAVGFLLQNNTLLSNAPVRHCIAAARSPGGGLHVQLLDAYKPVGQSCQLFFLWSRVGDPTALRLSLDGRRCLFDAGYKHPLEASDCPRLPEDPSARFTFRWDLRETRFRAIVQDRPDNPLCWDAGEGDRIVRLWNCKWHVFRGDNQSWHFVGRRRVGDSDLFEMTPWPE